MDPLLNSISKHIAFLGYSTPPPEPPPNIDIINAVHPSRPPFWVFPLSGGAFFRALYSLTADAHQDLNGYNSFINELNITSVLTHFFTSQDFLFIAAWYYGEYDAGRLGIFLDRFLFEATMPHRQFREQSERYLGPARYA